jgi:AraC-like DNA-binding protein
VRAQIDKAKHLLILTDLSITEVCLEVGFSSLGSFSSLFSCRAGMSPSEFQRRHRPVSRPERQLPASLVPAAFHSWQEFQRKTNFREDIPSTTLIASDA